MRIARRACRNRAPPLQGARAELLPEIGVQADGGRALQPEYLLPGFSRSQRTNNVFDAAFTASWELDFFGRNRRASESAAARVTHRRPACTRRRRRSLPRSRATTSSCAACSSA